MLLTLEGDEEDTEGCLDSPTEDSPTTPVLSEVSLNSVLGLTSPKTFKMKGSVLGHDVVVMVDPGATHNFISLSTVEKIGIPVVSTNGNRQ